MELNLYGHTAKAWGQSAHTSYSGDLAPVSFPV